LSDNSNICGCKDVTVLERNSYFEGRYRQQAVVERSTFLTFLSTITLGLISTLVQAKTSEADFEFHGYFRSGSNYLAEDATKNGGACYALPHPSNDGLYYRLGNECRDYGEFTFNKHLNTEDIHFKVYWTMDIAGDSRSPTAVENWSRRSRNLFVETDNLLDFGTLWVGRRYYRAVAFGDIHMIDAFQVNSSGNGVGISDIPLGENTLHLALIGIGSEAEDDLTTPQDETQNAQNPLFDIRYEWPLASGDTFKFGLQHQEVREVYQNAPDQNGSTLSVQWEKTYGIWDQRTGLQYALGSMAQNPGCFGTDGGTGCFNYAAASNAYGYRFYNNGTFNFDKFLLHYTLMFEKTIDDNVTAVGAIQDREVTSFGFRPHYSLGRYWSVVGEFTYNSLNPKFADEQTLSKYSIAIQATNNAANFWARPAIRFYLSQFEWNNRARDSGNMLNVPNSSEKQALLVGAQAEVWF
jgi:maltoporin